MRALLCRKLPIIDLIATGNAGSEVLSKLATAIRKPCGSAGAFYITNHGVPPILLQGVLESVTQLFDLPVHEKYAMDICKSPYMRGYFGYGADKSDGVNDDIKEGFDLGADLPITDPMVQAKLPFYGPNVWPQNLPNFRRNLTAYYGYMLKLGMDLQRALSVSLGDTETYFQQHFENPIAQLRLLRYPPHNDKHGDCIGAGQHTDFGCLTIILQDNAKGLEIKCPQGNWISVPPIADTLVVMIGDLMQRWTNDRYRAAVHRVLNHEQAARHSVAFFLDPDYKTIVQCLPQCVSITRPSRYEPIVVGDYIHQRYAQTTIFANMELNI